VSAQAKATLRKMQNDVRQAAARAFYNVEKAARSVSTFAAQVKLDTEQLERVNAMLRAGAGKPADVAAVERNLAQDKAELERRTYQERLARRTLNLALGRHAETPVQVKVDLEMHPEDIITVTALPPKEALAVETVRRRPELELARAVLAFDRKNVSIARA